MSIKETLASRWSNLEDRLQQVTKMLDELESIESDFQEVDLKSTTVYIVLQKELELINEEQRFILKVSEM